MVFEFVPFDGIWISKLWINGADLAKISSRVGVLILIAHGQWHVSVYYSLLLAWGLAPHYGQGQILRGPLHRLEVSQVVDGDGVSG